MTGGEEGGTGNIAYRFADYIKEVATYWIDKFGNRRLNVLIRHIRSRKEGIIIGMRYVARSRQLTSKRRHEASTLKVRWVR